MAVSYVTFMKHAEKVSKSASAARPILKGVHHMPGGTLAVTDSHRLYVAKNTHSNEIGTVIDPKTGATIDGIYPDVSRLTPEPSSAKFTIKLSVKETVDAFAALLKSNQVAQMERMYLTKAHVDDKRELIFSVTNQHMSASYNVGVVDGEQGVLSFSTSYMVDALALFKAIGFIEVELRYFGPMRPFTLTAGIHDELTALILPVRTGDA